MPINGLFLTEIFNTKSLYSLCSKSHSLAQIIIYFYNKSKPGDSSALQYMNGNDIPPNTVYWATTQIHNQPLMNLPESDVVWTSLRGKTMQLCECSRSWISDIKTLYVGHKLSDGPLHRKDASSQPDLIGWKALAVDLVLLQLWIHFSSNTTAHLLQCTNRVNNLIWSNK